MLSDVYVRLDCKCRYCRRRWGIPMLFAMLYLWPVHLSRISSSTFIITFVLFPFYKSLVTCTTAWMPPSAPCIAICDGHFVHNMLKSRLNKPYLPRQFFMSTNYTRLSVRTATYDLTLQLPYNPSSISHIHSYPYTCGKERYEILHRMDSITQIPDASEHSHPQTDSPSSCVLAVSWF